MSASTRPAPESARRVATSERAGPVPRPHPREVPPGTRTLLHSGLLLGLVVALIWGIALVQRIGAEDRAGAGSGSIEAQSKTRRDVQLAVSSFATTFNNYSVDDIGAYKKRMMPLMTAAFATSFEYAVDGIVTEVKATRMTSSGEVVQTAVSSIDDAHATVLVVADVDVSSALGDRERHFRWKVTVVRDGDVWLVDDFAPVA